MSNTALWMLFGRLLHPIPRVRWEAGRGIAQLIREGDRNATSILLKWIDERRLESEVILGLCIIDAYDLGSYFKFADVFKSVRIPSHLSDYLLKKNFTSADHLSPLRYAVTPSEPTTLPHEERAWFERHRKWAVPPIFSQMFRDLQLNTDFDFYMHWKHNWYWLQTTHARPQAEYRYFFSGGDRGYQGQFDHGQRELYVSAYLRTLAHASLVGAIQNEAAEDYSRLAITMNRGLADLEPITRPDWAENLFPCNADGVKQLARELWANAREIVRSDETLLAIRVVDHDRDGFIEFDMALVMGPSGFTTGPADAKTYNTTLKNVNSDEMKGPVEQHVNFDPLLIERPLSMVQGVLPEHIGRTHIEMALQIRLALPSIFDAVAHVNCDSSEIRLEAGEDVLSRWLYWYADWEPTIFPELQSSVGSITTVSKSRLNILHEFPRTEIAQLVQIRQGTRDHIGDECKIKSDAYWCKCSCEG